MGRRPASVIGAVLAGTALVVAGCGSDDPAPATTAEPDPAATTQATGTAEEPAVPREVIVCEPGLVDTAATVDDVPEWPGPRPADFMSITPSSGACGTLTGPDAQVVYEAALDHPGALLEEGEEPGDSSDALWALDTVVVWLVVDPVW